MEKNTLYSQTLHLDKKEGAYVNELKLSRTLPINAPFIEVPEGLGAVSYTHLTLPTICSV